MFATGQVWLNTSDYTGLELILFGIGCLGWVVAYAVVLRQMFRNQFIEIPAPAVAANIAWEFVWGFFFITNMGMLFAWGYRIWFFLDVVIVVGLLKYGMKQIMSPAVKQYFHAGVIFAIIAWAFALYFFIKEGHDTVTGATTGYILNVMMSALYVVLILARGVRDMSLVVAWSKLLGTFPISIFCFMVWPDNHFLLTLCVVTTVLDVMYVAVFYKQLRQSPVAAAA